MLTWGVHNKECEAASLPEISKYIVSRTERSEQGLTMQLRLALNRPPVSTS